jgi:DNA-binding NtrC family response regulator
MADRTVTEAELDPKKLAERRSERIGVVVAHCRGKQPWSAASLEASRTVGRDASADLVVDDPGVSRVHIRLERRDGALFVTDLESRNGTFVNGTPVPSEGRSAPVGALIRMAQTILVVVRDASPYLDERDVEPAELIGGASLDRVRGLISTSSSTTRPVLIQGETGTGKEIVARAVHDASGRRGRFVALNCAAVPSDLIDAELFGHTKGAFSNAIGARAGLFRSADRGTLFLDEIAEMPPAAQAKLLRTLETGEVRSVGSDSVVHVDVRIVAATNRDVDAMATAESFRTDLLHRVAGLRIRLPSLAERAEDVPSLVRHFTGEDPGISAQALEQLMLQPWPGNVRELRNVVLFAAELAKKNGHHEIDASDVAEVLAASSGRTSDTEGSRLESRIRRALLDAAGSVPKAAAALGMSRSALYENMRRLEIDASLFRSK